MGGNAAEVNGWNERTCKNEQRQRTGRTKPRERRLKATWDSVRDTALSLKAHARSEKQGGAQSH